MKKAQQQFEQASITLNSDCFSVVARRLRRRILMPGCKIV